MINHDTELRDRSALHLTLDGVITGALYTSINWTRNGTALSNMDPVPGIPNSEIFIGGGEELQGGEPCSARMYRPALFLMGYLPGVYQYIVFNNQTPDGFLPPILTVSGIYLNNICVCSIFSCHICTVLVSGFRQVCNPYIFFFNTVLYCTGYLR